MHVIVFVCTLLVQYIAFHMPMWTCKHDSVCNACNTLFNLHELMSMPDNCIAPFFSLQLRLRDTIIASSRSSCALKLQSDKIHNCNSSRFGISIQWYCTMPSSTSAALLRVRNHRYYHMINGRWFLLPFCSVLNLMCGEWWLVQTNNNNHLHIYMRAIVH